jgi:heme/copper-type cytochrome/quinol oxidase subunit 2
MSTKRILQILGVVALAGIIVFGVMFAVRTVPNEPTDEAGEKTLEPEKITDDVPELGELLDNESIAVPISVSDAAVGITSNHLRTYLISAENGKFTPSVVIVYKNDTVHIKFTAVDGTYDITVPDYGLQQTAKKGETKPLEFRAEKEGRFPYYCESCGEGTEARGEILVKAE